MTENIYSMLVDFRASRYERSRHLSFMTVFDDLYKDVIDYFGAEPDSLLVRFQRELAAGGRVLDVGAGQGRNALFLARQGIAVDCIDPSEVAEEQVWPCVLGDDLPVRFFPQRFETFVPDVDYYSAILAIRAHPGAPERVDRDSRRADRTGGRGPAASPS